MGVPVRGKVLAALGVVTRAAAVAGVIMSWNWTQTGPANDSGFGLEIYLLVSGIVFLWGVIDGIRRRFNEAALPWVLSTALLMLVVVGLTVAAGPPSLFDLFGLVYPAGILLIFVATPAAVGAAVGSLVRLVAARSG